MPGLMDEMMGALGGAEGGLGSVLGGLLGDQAADPKAEKAAGLGIEAILGGLANNAKDPGQAEALLDTLDRHDGSALDSLGPGYASAERTADGEKILGHVFGDNKANVTQNLAAKSGLDAGAIAKMLPALAPIVMGMLGKKKAGGGLDAGGLAGMLQGEAGGFDLGDILGMVTGGGSSGGGGGAGV